MPIYTVLDTQTNKEIEFEWYGESPPTDDDMEEVFVSARGPAESPFSKARRDPSTIPPQTPRPGANKGAFPGIANLPQDWEQAYPNLAGVKGAAQSLVRPGVETLGGVGGTMLGGPLGGALGYATAKKGMDAYEDVSAKVSGKPSGFDKPNMGLTPGETTKQILSSAEDVLYGYLFSKATDIASKSLMSAEQKLTGIVRNGIEKGVKPTGAGRGTPQLEKTYIDRAESGVKSIVLNKENLSYTDQNGVVVGQGRLPQNLREFSQAISQVKDRIFKQYDSLTTAAGEGGAKVSLSMIKKELQSVIDDPAMAFSPSAKAYAKKMLGEVKKIDSYSPLQAQTQLARINNRMGSFYKNESYEYADAKSIDDMIATHLRYGLDDAVQKTTGGQYQELKNAYGSLRSVESAVNHRANITAGKDKYGFFGYTDIWTAAEVARAVTDPTRLPSVVAAQGAKRYMNYARDPNTIIKKMFKGAEKAMKGIPPRTYDSLVKTSPIEKIEESVYRYNPEFKGTKSPKPPRIQTKLREGEPELNIKTRLEEARELEEYQRGKTLDMRFRDMEQKSGRIGEPLSKPNTDPFGPTKPPKIKTTIRKGEPPSDIKNKSIVYLENEVKQRAKYLDATIKEYERKTSNIGSPLSKPSGEMQQPYRPQKINTTIRQEGKQIKVENRTTAYLEKEIAEQSEILDAAIKKLAQKRQMELQEVLRKQRNVGSPLTKPNKELSGATRPRKLIMKNGQVYFR